VQLQQIPHLQQQQLGAGGGAVVVTAGVPAGNGSVTHAGQLMNAMSGALGGI
jgi:hypothetical protein